MPHVVQWLRRHFTALEEEIVVPKYNGQVL